MIKKFVSILVCALTCYGALAERVNVSGTRVYMEPPDGFTEARSFPGYQNKKLKAIIMVSEVPAPYLELSESHSSAFLSRKGLSVISREIVESDGLRGELIYGEQKIGTLGVSKWIFITGDANESVALTATYETKHNSEISDSIKASLRDAIWESAQVLNHFDGLGFSLSEIPGLRIATRVSNTVIFTRDGRLPDQYYAGPLLIVGWSDIAENPKNPRAYARARFNDISLLSERKIVNTETINLSDFKGFETVGRGKHRYLGFTVSVLQVIAFDDGRVLKAQGFTETDEQERNYDLFRTVIGTFRLTD